MCFMIMPSFPAHSNSVPLIYSGPLPTRMVPCFFCYLMIQLRLRTARSADKEKLTLMLMPSRLKSSSTFNSWKAWPLLRRSAMKFIDQVILCASGAASASGLSRFNRLRGLMRKFSSSLL